MSTTTLKLPFKRFVAQVSSAPARSKSSYLALMAENLEALKKCPWREAAVVPVSLTGHDFTASTQFGDAFDAFKLTGNYETATMTEIAYAGMAAYRFKIPASAMTGSVPVVSVSLPVSRDRFLKDGLHVATAFSDSAEPSADWETIRGSGALAASSVLAQSAATLMEGSADATTVTLDLSGVSSGNPAAYLWVYVTLEDYTDRWTMYNAKEKRLYAVEGSAMLAGDGAEVTFDGTVTADSGETERYLVNPIPVRVAFWKYPTMPKLRFRTLHWMGYGNWRHLAPTGEWTFPAGTSDFPFVCDLETTGRRIPTGDCVLECWIDEGGGEFNPGMPYGCVLLEGLTSASSPERAEIELTRTNSSIVRIDLAAAIRATTFDAATAATDRSKCNTLFGYAANEPLPEGTATDLSGYNTTSLTRVRVVRTKLNDNWFSEYSDSESISEILLDTYFDLSARHVLTEADLRANRLLGLDWRTVLSAWGGGAAGLKRAGYRILIGDGDMALPTNSAPDLESFAVPILFSQLFEGRLRQTPTVQDTRLSGQVFSACPTFRWSHTNDIRKKYPAFQLRIYTDSNKENLVYSSGNILAPVRDEDGFYRWTAPVRVGTTTEERTIDTNTTVQGHTFAAGTTYYWAVSMLDDLYSYFSREEPTLPFTFAAS